MKIFSLFFFAYFISFTQSSDSNIVFIYEHARHEARSPLFYDGNKKYLDRIGTQWEGQQL